MIKPSVGRVVLVVRPYESNDTSQPEVGFITYVHNDRLVNLAGFNGNGAAFAHTSVTLVQPDDPKPEDGMYAEWMPYQVGQAQKVEELEAKLLAATRAAADTPQTS